MHIIFKIGHSLGTLRTRGAALDARSGEAGMTTAELLGNAALGIAALVAIWAVLQTLGLDIVDWMRGQLRV
jgi:hypothetical protein